MKQFLKILTLLLCSLPAQAYIVSPVCPDFTDIHAGYAEATTGYTSTPLAKQGVVNGRHTLITTQGTDPNTGGALALLPDGESRVVRLGNEYVGAEAEALTYHFIVDKNNPVLLLKFAVVLENPQHKTVQQPRFVVRITDKNDNLIEECAEYDVSAHEGITGFKTYQKGWGSPIRWRDWTNVGLDMSSFIGQELQVQFITYDCSEGAHFGYAYFTASCIPSILQLEACEGTSFTVAAPEGFESYLWDNGETTRTSTRTDAGNNNSLSCLVTSATGCQFRLNAYVTSSSVSIPAFIQDTVCEGDIYNRNYFDLPEQYKTGTSTYYNTILNTAACNTTQTTELALTVLPRYTHIKAAICNGDSYTENGFDIVEPAAGVRRDTLFLSSRNERCDSIVYLELTVNPSLSLPNSIAGDDSPCTDEPFTYSFAGEELLTNFSWDIPNNAVVVGKSNQAQITLYFTDNTPVILSLNGENGCGNGTVSHSINPRQTYSLFFTDTICAGTDYDKYGFRLGAQNEIGYFVHTHGFKSVLGCDSTVTLALTVFPSLVVPRIVGDTVSCNPGNEITLLAMDSATTYTFNPEMLKDSTFSYAYDCRINYLWSTGSTEHSITDKPTSTTTYSVTLSNSMGCSATAYQTVVVGSLAAQTIYDTICNGETYTKYGLNETTSDDYPVNIVDAACTVPLTINLTVLPVYYEVIDDNVCYGTTYAKHGFNITPYESGLISQTFRYQTKHGGCDSLVMVRLLVSPEKTAIVHDTICQNETYTKNGFALFEQIFSGLQTHTKVFESVEKCDSMVTLKLFVKPVYNNIISDEAEQNKAYNKFNFNLTKVTQDTTVTRNLKSVEKCDSAVVLNLKVSESGPVYQAVNDTVSLTPCQDYVTVNVLDNDSYPCSDPTVRVLDTPFPGTQLTRSGNRLIYYPNFDFNRNYLGQTDSVRYSISCGSQVIDTAWVFFQYPPSLDPWIEFESRFDKSCFAAGDTIVESVLIRLHNNQGCNVLNNIYYAHSLSSQMADFSGISASYSTMDDSTEMFRFSYKVLTINSGYESTITTTSSLYILSSLGYIQMNNNKTSDFSICDEITMTDCELSHTFPVTHANATAYRLSQRARLPGAEDSISQDGVFSYTSPWLKDIARDSVKYEVDLQNGITVSGTIFINILPCIDSVLVESTMNEECNFDDCKYDGPSILINEVMITPEKYDGAIYGYQCTPNEAKGGEWIEIYNPHSCDSVDISGYFLANSTTDAPKCDSHFIRPIGAAFVLPEGTVIPPMGFCVLRGQHAATVDSVRLIENGGNTVVINLMDYFDRFCLDNNGNRFWLPNIGGWFGFFNRNGVPQDAIYWGSDKTDICNDCHPCNPQMAGTYSGVLASLDAFPADRKTRVSDLDLNPWIGITPKRQPDGGTWAFNDFTPPTMGYCNGICNTRAESNCNGTVSAQAYGGTGSFSYLWDDPWRQTTQTATGLCEGTYYCTITDSNTGLKRIVRAIVKNDWENCPEVNAVNDMISLISCQDTTLHIPLLKNDFYTCNKPELSLLTVPTLPGNTAQLVNDTLVFHFKNAVDDVRDLIQYKIVCNGLKPAADSAWVFIEIKKETLYLLLKADTTKLQIGDKIKLTVTPTNDKHGIYRWYDITGRLLGETTVNTFEYTLDRAGSYAFYVLTNNGYCPAESNIVNAEVADYWIIPNIITPYNYNGLNDTFMTPREGRPGYRVEIYNRYQQKVFEGDNGWDGTYRGKLADPGTYYYRIFMKDGRILKGPLEVAKF